MTVRRTNGEDITKKPRRRVPWKRRLAHGMSVVAAAGADGRTQWTRAVKEQMGAHFADLGGEDNTSAAERAIIRRASVLVVELERLEAQFASAQPSPDAFHSYQVGANTMRCLFQAVGIRRRARTVTAPDVAAYLAHVSAHGTDGYDVDAAVDALDVIDPSNPKRKRSKQMQFDAVAAERLMAEVGGSPAEILDPEEEEDQV